MVELNNKLKLPIYTSFENKFRSDFEPFGKSKIICEDFEIIDKKFDTTLDIEVEQIKNHFNNITDSHIININENKSEMINILITGEENFKQSIQININENIENKILIEFDFNSLKSSINLEIHAHDNSNSEVIIISKGVSSSRNFIKANVYRDATCNIYYINSAKDDLNDVSVALLGVNSSSKLKTVALSKDAKKYFSSRIDHFAKNSYGRLVNHGVALDNSTLVIDGFGKIHKDCKQSDNYQKSKILSLGNNSKVEANPILLIDEYDVWASHAASVSNVDPDQLYYLRSRGLSEEQAKVVLIKGFLKSIVNEIDSSEIAELFESILDEKIGYKDEF